MLSGTMLSVYEYKVHLFILDVGIKINSGHTRYWFFAKTFVIGF